MTDAAALRRRTMQAVKSHDTKPELAVRSLLHSLGYRFRLHRKDLPGCPDLVFPARRAIVFVHGCFWHGHDCARGARLPKSNAAYWAAKIERNRVRYLAQQNALAEAGWRVHVVWECQLRNPGAVLRNLTEFLGPTPTRG